MTREVRDPLPGETVRGSGRKKVGDNIFGGEQQCRWSTTLGTEAAWRGRRNQMKIERSSSQDRAAGFSQIGGWTVEEKKTAARVNAYQRVRGWGGGGWCRYQGEG